MKFRWNPRRARGAIHSTAQSSEDVRRENSKPGRVASFHGLARGLTREIQALKSKIQNPLPFALLAITLPWSVPTIPPKGSVMVLIQPAYPETPPEGYVVELPDDPGPPDDWRSSEQASPKRKGNAGLDTLRASGSAQFSLQQSYGLQKLLLGRNVVIVDLCQEPHTFLDGAAISWGPPDLVGTDRSADAVMATESAWTHHADAAKFVTVAEYAPYRYVDTKTWQPVGLRLDVREAQTEDQLAAAAGWGYFRIAAPDNVLPRDADLDRFVAFVRELQQSEWLHFHCDTGGYRTTLYLTLYDMMRSYSLASRDQIIARERLLSSYDLLAGSAKRPVGDFLARFFNYCWQCGPRFGRNWSSWSRAHP